MDKKCDYKHTDVRLYVQNRMSREEETEFQHHLQNCENCRKELTILRRMVRSMEKKEKRTISLRTWIIAASLACLLIGEGVYYYYSTKGSEHFFPSSGNILKIHPAEQHLQKDSILPQDSIPDTLQIFTDPPSDFYIP